MDIAIVDDEPLARQRLHRLVSELGYEVIAEASNSEAAMEMVNVYDPSVLLLDIEMPGENGLSLAEKISQLDTPPAIIFTTAYDQYALDAFATVASGYLLKPIQKELLQQELDKTRKINKVQMQGLQGDDASAAKQRKHITSKGHRGIELISLDDIRYFMADQKYVMVTTTHGQVLIDETLKELESEFTDCFVRVHRNALISIKHIDGLERDQEGHYHIRFIDIDDKPMVSRRYASRVKRLLKTL